MLRRLHAGLHANQITDILGEPLVETDQKIDGAYPVARQRRQVLAEARRRRLHHQIRRQLATLGRLIFEGKMLGVIVQKEVEWIEHRHLGHQVDLDAQLAGRVGDHDAGEVVGLGSCCQLMKCSAGVMRWEYDRMRALLCGAGRSRITLRPERHPPVIAIMSDMIQCDVNRQAVSPDS